MKKLKKFPGKILIFTIIIAIMAPIFAVEIIALTQDGWSYIIEGGNAVIYDYTSTSKSVVIPSELGSSPVTEIRYITGETKGNAVIKTTASTVVTIPASVNILGENSFGECKEIRFTEMTNLSSIDNKAFYTAETLREFRDLSSSDTASFRVYNGVLYNGASLFHYPNNRSDNNFKVPGYSASDSFVVTKISPYAFSTSMQEDKESNAKIIYLSKSIDAIDETAFKDSRGIKAVNIENGNKFYVNMNNDGVVYKKSAAKGGTDTLMFFPSYKGVGKSFEYTLPATVGIIDYYSLIRNESVKGINAATGNANFSSEGGVLLDRDKLTLYYYPPKKTVKKYVIPESVDIIDTYAFSNQDFGNLENLVIPYTVLDIKKNAINGEFKSVAVQNPTLDIDDENKFSVWRGGKSPVIFYTEKGSTIEKFVGANMAAGTYEIKYTESTDDVYKTYSMDFTKTKENGGYSDNPGSREELWQWNWTTKVLMLAEDFTLPNNSSSDFSLRLPTGSTILLLGDTNAAISNTTDSATASAILCDGALTISGGGRLKVNTGTGNAIKASSLTINGGYTDLVGEGTLINAPTNVKGGTLILNRKKQNDTQIVTPKTSFTLPQIYSYMIAGSSSFYDGVNFTDKYEMTTDKLQGVSVSSMKTTRKTEKFPTEGVSANTLYNVESVNVVPSNSKYEVVWYKNADGKEAVARPNGITETFTDFKKVPNEYNDVYNFSLTALQAQEINVKYNFNLNIRTSSYTPAATYYFKVVSIETDPNTGLKIRTVSDKVETFTVSAIMKVTLDFTKYSAFGGSADTQGSTDEGWLWAPKTPINATGITTDTPNTVPGVLTFTSGCDIKNDEDSDYTIKLPPGSEIVVPYGVNATVTNTTARSTAATILSDGEISIKGGGNLYLVSNTGNSVKALNLKMLGAYVELRGNNLLLNSGLTVSGGTIILNNISSDAGVKVMNSAPIFSPTAPYSYFVGNQSYYYDGVDYKVPYQNTNDKLQGISMSSAAIVDNSTDVKPTEGKYFTKNYKATTVNANTNYTSYEILWYEDATGKKLISSPSGLNVSYSMFNQTAYTFDDVYKIYYATGHYSSINQNTKLDTTDTFQLDVYASSYVAAGTYYFRLKCITTDPRTGFKTHSVSSPIALTVGAAETSTDSDKDEDGDAAEVDPDDPNGKNTDGNKTGSSEEGDELVSRDRGRPEWITPAKMSALVSENSNNKTVSEKSEGIVGVSKKALRQLDKSFEHTSTDNGRTTVRLTVTKPQEARSNIYVSAALAGKEVDRVTKAISKRYTNDFEVIHMDQVGAYGLTVRIAATISLPNLDKDNLHFYSVNMQTKKITKLSIDKYYFDSSGYIHFDTAYGGDIIITDTPLTKK